MYIISKQKDYYDGVVGTMGIDKSIVYERNEVELRKNKIPKEFNLEYFHRQNKSENSLMLLMNFRLNKDGEEKYDGVSYFVVGFCGKLYVGWKLYNMVDRNLVTTITYDFEFMKSILKNSSWYVTNINDAYNNIVNHDASSIFVEYNTPVFIYDDEYEKKYILKYYQKDESCFIINPILKDYEFYKIFDSFSAFQEIQMYIGGVLGKKEKEIIVVDDKYKIAQHGFDKWSFRKMKEEK